MVIDSLYSFMITYLHEGFNHVFLLVQGEHVLINFMGTFYILWRDRYEKYNEWYH